MIRGFFKWRPFIAFLSFCGLSLFFFLSHSSVSLASFYPGWRCCQDFLPHGHTAADGLPHPLSSFRTGQVAVSENPIWSMTHHHFSLFFPPVRLFLLHKEANVQPCGRPTEKLGPYANFMTAEAVVSCKLQNWCDVWQCTYFNPDFWWIIDGQQGQGLLLMLPCGALRGLELHLHS